VHYSAEECVATGYDPARPCEGLTEGELSRIYWQKVGPYWSADEEPLALETDGKAYVSYVDWGDALEAVSWTERSRVRVETQPYSSRIPMFDPTVESCEEASEFDQGDPEVDCKVGFQMWHVSGQGITEHWGVRATEPDPVLGGDSVSYNYDSPFQIIHTSNARLNIARLVTESATCPEPGGNANDPPPGVEVQWFDNGDGSGSWLDDVGNKLCEFYDQPYTVELSVGGKYVYGYNLRMKNVDLTQIPECAGYFKTGYYRLTFYAPDDVIFDDALAPNVAPPAVPSEVRALPRNGNFNTATAPPPPVPATEDEDPTADDRLYKPVVDTDNNLTYLDICIVAKTQGGGGGGGKKPAETQ
ncbi:MAG: hypothetical protein OES18_11655, partial [Deltaproteobacteria bacterium]|nr:hypothetical protein [Deltaproteobacteria bacterium]